MSVCLSPVIHSSNLSVCLSTVMYRINLSVCLSTVMSRINLSVCLSTVLHSLQVFLTSSSGLPTFPEVVAVAMVDGVEIGYYDSNIQGVVHKQGWMYQIYRDHPGELEMITERALGAQQRLKAKMLDLKKLFNQTEGKFISDV